MEVVIKNGQTSLKDIHIKNQNNIFSMIFMDVGDLFWTINKSNRDSTKEIMIIPQTEKDIYKLFDKLYNDINQAKLFEEHGDDFIKQKLLERNLFNPQTHTIEWHSDDTLFDSDDVVKIIKKENSYQLEFTRPEEYEDPYHRGSSRMISIRFRNSGSYYDPFNIAFMNMFREAQNLRQKEFKGLHNLDSEENEL